MKTVLMITNSFPPLTGGGVLRPSRLAKYFPEWGWTPVVLTMSVSKEATKLGEPGEKYACDILRPPRFDPTEYYRVVRRVFGWFRWAKPFVSASAAAATAANVATVPGRPRLMNYVLVPDNRVFWIPGAILTGLWAVWRRRPQAIFSMAPEPSAHLAAWGIAKVTGIRWVAEFRDPWITNPFRHPRPFRWMERLENWLEQRVVHDCDHLCVTSIEYKEDFLRRCPGLPVAKVSHIPNGFDPADFDGLMPAKFDKFTILHAGNFYGARSASGFLATYAALLARRPEWGATTQVAFVGSIDADATALIGQLRLQDNVALLGHHRHAESLRLTCGADILLLIPGPGNGTMPGKTFEYLRAARPVYCYGAEGPAARLIEEVGAGIVEPGHSTAAGAASLENLMELVMRNPSACICPAVVLRRFNRREIAGRIASVLATTTNVQTNSTL